MLVRVGVYERPTAENGCEARTVNFYHRVENGYRLWLSFLNSSLELGSGRGEKMPRNVRFAYNLFTGQTLI